MSFVTLDEQGNEYERISLADILPETSNGSPEEIFARGIEKETSCSAVTPGKRLVIPRISRRRRGAGSDAGAAFSPSRYARSAGPHCFAFYQGLTAFEAIAEGFKARDKAITEAFKDRDEVISEMAASILLLMNVTTVPGAILYEAGISFLGLGVIPPMPSWGRMLFDAQTRMIVAPYLAIFPGMAIVITVLGLNLIGDGISDTLDPKLRTRR